MSQGPDRESPPVDQLFAQVYTSLKALAHRVRGKDESHFLALAARAWLAAEMTPGGNG